VIIAASETAAALFDMDGTLLDSSAAVVASWTEFAEDHGLDVEEVLHAVHGVRAVESVARFLPAELVEAETAKLLDREMHLTDGIVEIAGAAALLEALPAAGVPVAIVTSAPRDLAIVRLEAAGIPIPTVFVTGDDVERGKPAPDCYLLAAERLGVDPARCVVFEDAEAGLRAGLAAGARVVVVGGYASATTEPLTRLADYREVSAAR
jgi:mannitol-1-/sugar-/sorbitol-6-phosphatase